VDGIAQYCKVAVSTGSARLITGSIKMIRRAEPKRCNLASEAARIHQQAQSASKIKYAARTSWATH
jgi:hypothetical protein